MTETPRLRPVVNYLLIGKISVVHGLRYCQGTPVTGDAVVKTADQMTAGTPARILDIAERLVQVRGFNGFSYADVAAELHITTAALHYHFTGKPQLGLALIDRYAVRFGQALADLDATAASAPDRLRGYVALY